MRQKEKNNVLASSWRLFFLVYICLICLANGCKETSSSSKGPKVVRQKIAVQKPDTKKNTAESKKLPKDSEKDLVKDPQSPAKPAAASESAQQKKKEEKPAPILKAAQKKTIQPASQNSQQLTTQPAPEKKGKKLATKEKQGSEEPVYSYNPEGKIDPFKPILSGVSGRASGSRKKRSKTVPLTPLQKININQVKLVGIIESPNGNKAMVQDPSGKGYILTKGTYIGTNFGKVAKILSNKVVVQEEIEDFITGKLKIQEVTLELPKKYEDGSVQ